ncbi:MAG: ATP synthase F1 subunit delta [Deltaproteobacteria bacterium]|nr:ATP synthase F1 subunit delta [Deltaproteobacteria bacterium]
MTGGSLGRRYAKALLEIAKGKGEVDRVGVDVGALLDAIATSGELKSLCENPAFAKSQRRKVLDALAERLGATETVKKFVRLLVDRDRIGHLGAVGRAYQGLADEVAGRVRASVASATRLTDTDRAAITSAIAAATGKTVVLEESVDATLIAGLVTRVGSVVYDGSLRMQLAAMRERMLAE